MLKHRTFLFLAIVVVLAIIIVLVVFAVETPETKIRQSLNLYPNSRLLFEDTAVYGAGVTQKSLYYWTDEPVLSVKAHYEQTIGAFVTSADQDREWLINAYKIDDFRPTPDVSSDFLTHRSFCPNIEERDCVSVVIVAADQPEVYTLPVMSPSGFRRSTAPVSFQSLNPRGTFIVYSYWINDF